MCGDIHLNPGPGHYFQIPDDSAQSISVTHGFIDSEAVSYIPFAAEHLDIAITKGNNISSSLIHPDNPASTFVTWCSSSDRHAVDMPLINIATIKQQRTKMFQNVNHAKVHWDP